MLFHAAGGRLYVNRLETQCSGLRRNRSFVYQSRGGGHNVELCERDILTVIDPHATSCRVGRSFEITKDQAEALRKRTAD
ncbi:MAG TPA: hypothetical protein VFV10_07715 [Gammaproteobacteria bacterium]|nr:hypothetical protein [Gammaproteobacteria bacterium]